MILNKMDDFPIHALIIAGSEDEWKFAYILSEQTRYTKYTTFSITFNPQEC